MESQLEDKEAELGRSLNSDELKDWLKQMGPPILVAARYQPQQYLIGPAVFPIYWYVLRMALLWATVIYSAVSALLIALKTPSGPAVFDAFLRVPGVLITVAAWVTAVFVAIEFAATHYPGKWTPIAAFSGAWTPSSLPPLEKSPAPGAKSRSYSRAVAEIVFGFLFTGWLLLIPQNPFLMFGPGAAYFEASPFKLAAVWMVFFWWIVALNVVQLAWRCLDLWRGAWQQSGSAQHIVVKVFGLIPLGLLIAAQDHAYVLLRHPALDQLRYAHTLDSINSGIHLGLLLICAIAILQLAWDIGGTIAAAYRKRLAAR